MADPLVQIRDEVHAVLFAAKVLGSAYPEEHYYSEFPAPMPDQAIPSLNFMFTGDALGHDDAESDYFNLAIGGQKRTAVFEIEIWTRFKSNQSDALNPLHQIRRKVLAALAKNRGLNDQVGTDFLHVEFIDTEWRIERETETPLAVAILSFSAKYHDAPQLDA